MRSQPSISQADREFLDGLLEQAIERLEQDKPLELDAMLAGHTHLRISAEAVIRLAREVAVGRNSSLPKVRGYSILAEIGSGGMGTVYLARQDRVAGRLVALKVLPTASALSPRARERFIREAEALARVHHPHVITIFDVVHSRDVLAYAMEYIEGQSFANWIDACGGPRVRQSRPAPIPAGIPRRDKLTSSVDSNVPFVCRTGISIARALHDVHAIGLLHRDVKPSNILIRQDGAAVLSDFGLVREADSTVTQPGHFAGTPAYASPEQLRGDIQHIDARSDVYSLGVTLYHALALRVPFEGDRPSKLLGSIEAGHAPALRKLNAQLPRDLDTIIAKAMDADPARRYQTANELADDLERLLTLRPIKARPAGLATRTLKLARRNRRSLSAAVVGALIALTIGTAAVIYTFFIPRWVAWRLREAHLALLDPGQANFLYERIFFGFPQSPDPARTLPPGGLTNALKHYDSALRLSPFDARLRIERDIVAAVLKENADPQGPRTDAADDYRSSGLRQFLRGDIEASLAAWEQLELSRASVGAADPLVEGALGLLYLIRDEPARAYPRLRTACEAFPNVGFLTGYLADAAVQCGDLPQAQRLLELAERQPRGDSHGSLTRIRANLYAALGRDADAERIFQTAKPQPPLVYAYGKFLKSRSRIAEALNQFHYVAVRTTGFRPHREFVETADQWWASLTSRERMARICSSLHKVPWDRRSFITLLRQYSRSVQIIASGNQIPSARESLPSSLLDAWESGGFGIFFALSTAILDHFFSPSLQSLSMSELAQRMEVSDMSNWNWLPSYPIVLKHMHLAAWRHPSWKPMARLATQSWNTARRFVAARTRALSATLIITTAVSTAHGQTVTFSDGTFDPADWTRELNVVGPASQTYLQTASGNPGTCFQITDNINDGSETTYVGGLFIRIGAVYDPSVSGPIESLDVSTDHIMFLGFGDGQAHCCVLRQAGQYYYGACHLTNNVTWTTRSFTGLTAAAFGGVDFSSNGSAIEFGFRRANSGPGPYTIVDGIDNWSVTIHQACTSADSPDITQQPQSANPAPGATVNLSVVASGTAPLSYQWRKGGVDLNNGVSGCSSTISGATTATLTITNVSSSDNAAYDCVVTNACGSDTSDAATLTVSQGSACAGDMDGNNVVDGDDIAPFVAKLLAGGSCP